MLDASCAPSNIKYPQDFQLLSDAREKLEAIIENLRPIVRGIERT